MNSTRQELADEIREIRDEMVELVGRLAEIARVDDSEFGRCDATNYIVPGLEIRVSNEHRWVSGDKSLDDWIEALESEDEEIDEDDPRF